MTTPAAEARRIPIGPLVGLAGAVLLLVSLFLDWWQGVSAFTAFEVLDLVLAVLALAVIAALVQALDVWLPPPAPSPAIALPLAVVALVVVVSQLLNDPPLIAGSDLGPAVGIWLALGAGVLMVAGCALSAARISLALDPAQREASRRRRSRRAGADETDQSAEPAAARMRARAAARAAAAARAEGAPEPRAEAAPAARTEVTPAAPIMPDEESAGAVPEPERPVGD